MAAPVDDTARLAGAPIHFTCDDGQFYYRCETCRARCCRAAPQIFLAPGQESLVERFGGPLACHLDPAGRIIVDLTPRPCRLLDRQHRCALHVAEGRAALPALCAMFPYSRVLDAGAFVVAGPDFSFVCPLHLRRRAGDRSRDRHELAADLAHFYAGQRRGLPRVALHATDPVLLDDELRFGEACRAAPAETSPRYRVARLRGCDPAVLAAQVRDRLALVALAPSDAAPTWSGLWLALLPTLRTYLYELPTRSLDGALLLTCALAELRLVARHARPSLSTLAQLFLAELPLGTLLAHSDDTVQVPPQFSHHAPVDPHLAVEWHAFALRSARGATLAEALTQVELPPVARLWFAAALARAGLRFP